MYKVEKLDHQGRGIIHINNKIAFVPFTIPDDIIQIQIIKDKKNYIEAKLTTIVEKSSKRINSPCPYFEKCGGCDLLNLSYENQLIYKENKVKEIIHKFAGIDIDIKPIIPNPNPFNYRNKVTLKVNTDIGLYEANTNKLVPIEKCYLVNEKINLIISKLKKLDMHHIEEIIIRNSNETNETMVIISVNKNFDYQYLIVALKNITTSIIIKNKKQYTTIYGKNYIIDKIGDFSFKISADSFFQVNTPVAYLLYEQVKKACQLQGNEKILDLYCGTGTIGLYLSKYCKEVLGLEINQYAIKDANENKEMNNIDNVKFVCSDASQFNKSFKPDIVIVDPPRNGLDTNCLNNIISINPQKIIYVSCDPVTLARDLKLLSNKYATKYCIPVDMFSNTNHVECVVLLSKSQ